MLRVALAFISGAIAGYFYAWMRVASDPTDMERRVRALQR